MDKCDVSAMTHIIGRYSRSDVGIVTFLVVFYATILGYAYLMVTWNFDILPFSMGTTVLLVHVIMVVLGLIAGYYLSKD